MYASVDTTLSAVFVLLFCGYMHIYECVFCVMCYVLDFSAILFYGTHTGLLAGGLEFFKFVSYAGFWVGNVGGLLTFYSIFVLPGMIFEGLLRAGPLIYYVICSVSWFSILGGVTHLFSICLFVLFEVGLCPFIYIAGAIVEVFRVECFCDLGRVFLLLTHIGGFLVDYFGIFEFYLMGLTKTIVTSAWLGIFNTAELFGVLLLGLEPSSLMVYYYLALTFFLLIYVGFGAGVSHIFSKRILVPNLGGTGDGYAAFKALQVGPFLLLKIFASEDLNWFSSTAYRSTVVGSGIFKLIQIRIKFGVWVVACFVCHVYPNPIRRVGIEVGVDMFSLLTDCKRWVVFLKIFLRFLLGAVNYAYGKIVWNFFLVRVRVSDLPKQSAWNALGGSEVVSRGRFLGLIGSAPLYITGCFSENLFWLNLNVNAVMCELSPLTFKEFGGTRLASLTMNSRFIRELGLTQLQFTEKNFLASRLVSNYFARLDSTVFELTDFGDPVDPFSFSPLISELSSLRAQFGNHHLFVSLFIPYFHYLPIKRTIFSVADNTDIWTPAVIEVIKDFLDTKFSSSIFSTALAAPCVVLVTLISPFFEFFSLLSSVSGGEFEGERGSLAVHPLFYQVTLLKSLIGGLTFISNKATQSFESKTLTSKVWRANRFLA